MFIPAAYGHTLSDQDIAEVSPLLKGLLDQHVQITKLAKDRGVGYTKVTPSLFFDWLLNVGRM